MKALSYERHDDKGLLIRVSRSGEHNRRIFSNRALISEGYSRYKAIVRRPYRYVTGIDGALSKALEAKYKEGRDGKGSFSFIKLRNDNPGTTCCPYCGRGGTGTIDHYLPQSQFPLYSIFSLNLVPACHECQVIKSDRILSANQGRPIHPLLDAVTLSQHLVIRWSFGGATLMDAAFEFDVAPIVRWSKRIRSQERRRFIRHWRFFALHKRIDVAQSCYQALNDIRIRLEEDAIYRPHIKTDISALGTWLSERIQSAAHYCASTTSPMLQEAILRGLRLDLNNAKEFSAMPLPAKAVAQNRNGKLVKRRQR